MHQSCYNVIFRYEQLLKFNEKISAPAGLEKMRIIKIELMCVLY